MAAPAANTRLKKRSLLIAIKDLDTATKEVASYTKDIQTIEELRRDNGSLNVQLAEKVEEISKEKRNYALLKNKFDQLSHHFEERFTAWVKEREELKLKIKNCQVDFETFSRHEKESLQKKVGGLQGKIEKQSDDINAKETTIRGLEARLSSSLEDMKQLTDKIGWQKIELDFVKDLDSLEMRLRELAKKYFCTELPPNANHGQILQECRRVLLPQHRVNLGATFPISNSPCSMELRAATMESIIAEHIATDIFQDSRLVVTKRKLKMDRMLENLVKEDVEQEAIFRSLLHMLFKKEELDLRKRAISDAVSEISEISQSLLFHDFDGFCGDLEVLLQQAADIWEKAQRSPKKVLSTTDPSELDDWTERKYDAPERYSEDGLRDPGPRHPVMVLFPRIWFYPESNALRSGTAIWSDQAIIHDGLSELAQQSVKGHRRVSLNHQDISQRSTNGSTSSTRIEEEISPGSRVSRNGSFSQRMQNPE